jgi:hypothetical protein
MKKVPAMVRPMVVRDECSLWASGRISEAPMYKRKPAKQPKYSTK